MGYIVPAETKWGELVFSPLFPQGTIAIGRTDRSIERLAEGMLSLLRSFSPDWEEAFCSVQVGEKPLFSPDGEKPFVQSQLGLNKRFLPIGTEQRFLPNRN